MSKQEFIQGLREALAGEIPAERVQENVRYYNDYIDSEVRNGKSEEEVIAEIGDPRWIAKTIIDVTLEAGGGKYGTQSEAYQNSYTDESGQDPYRNREKDSIHYYDLNRWYVRLGVLLVVVTIFTLIGGLLSLLIPMMPVIGLIILAVLIVRRLGR